MSEETGQRNCLHLHWISNCKPLYCINSIMQKAWNNSYQYNICFPLRPHYREESCKSAVWSQPVWLWMWSCVCRGERGESPTLRGQRSRRRAPQLKASCQPPAERRTTGHQTEWFGKRTSQGHFQLAQCVVCSEQQGLRGRGGEAGGSWGEEEGEKPAGRNTNLCSTITHSSAVLTALKTNTLYCAKTVSNYEL